MSKSASKIKNMASPPCYYKRVMAREFLKRRHSITLAIIIIIFSPIHICGPFSVSANSYATSLCSHPETVCNNSAVDKEHKIAKLKVDLPPRIILRSPQGGEVWKEGKTYEISWKSQGVAQVYISVAVGGKDKGLLEEKGNSAIEAQTGKLAWTIPLGFITDFGISRSDRVRIMIFDMKDSTISCVSEYFTIEGARATVKPSAENTEKTQDEYQEAIRHYYKAIADKQYRDAYKMLGQYKITIYNADGSGVAYQPRDDYESWLKAQKNIDKVTIIDVQRLHRAGDQYHADQGDAEATMGIRTYEVTLDIQLREEQLTLKSGRNAFLVSVIKGIDDKVRIIGIGTGP